MRILITGADGFLGSRLLARMRREGWDAAGLVRNPSTKQLPAGEYFHYAFPAEIDPQAFASPVDVLIHCAFAMRDFALYHQNRQAAAFLHRQPAGRMVFISSMSAHEAAESRYGREKLHIEGMMNPARDASIRPGFIIGNGGVFRQLARSIQSAPAIPLFYGGGQPIQTVWVDDVCDAVAAIVRKNAAGLFKVAEREPVRIGDFYKTVAAKLGLKKTALPLPGTPALWALRGAEALGLKLPMHSDNLLGLKQLIRYDVTADLRALEIDPTPMTESLKLVDWNTLCR